MSHRILCVCLISASTLALAERPAVQSSGYVYRRGFAYDVPDPYEHDASQKRMAALKLSWEFSDQPQQACSWSDSDGVYHYKESCAIWRLQDGQMHCRIVTRKSLSHEVLGRLFVACQNGGTP